MKQLIELPAPVGNKIWYLNGKYVLECIITGYYIDDDGVSLIHMEYTDPETQKVYSHCMGSEYIGKTLFFEKKELEKII